MKQIISLVLIVNYFGYAQKIDIDSLLAVTYKEINQNKNYPKAIALAHIGIKKAPNYLDFHMALGRTYMITQAIDSSRYYFNYVLDRNTNYTEGYKYLTQLEIAQNNSQQAVSIIDKGLYYHPDNVDFIALKREALTLKQGKIKTVPLYSKNQKVTDTINPIAALSSERIGLNYNNTSFGRAGIGPWHLIGLQYVRERKRLTLIAGVNYAERYNFNSKSSGFEYEFSTYAKMFSKSYSAASVSWSNDSLVFPKLRLAYSYNHNFSKGWEAEVGIRYTKTEHPEFYTGVLGIGKYIGSYWFNLKTYVLFFESKTYPSFTAVTRYYFNTKYDYISATMGYGSSPDERVTLNQFQDRFAFDSYRIGFGYNRIFTTHYLIGLAFNYNNQEYQTSKYQSEYNVLMSLQYKF